MKKNLLKNFTKDCNKCYVINQRSTKCLFSRVYYAWNAITADYDDNKFFDAAVAGNVDYLVTNDAHFNSANKLYFPKVKIVTSEEFLNLL